MGSFEFRESANLFLLARLLHEGVESGLLTGSGILLDNLFLSGFVEGLDRLLQLLLGFIKFTGSDGLASLFDSTFDDTVSHLVAEGVLGGHAHVFLG